MDKTRFDMRKSTFTFLFCLFFIIACREKNNSENILEACKEVPAASQTAPESDESSSSEASVDDTASSDENLKVKTFAGDLDRDGIQDELTETSRYIFTKDEYGEDLHKDFETVEIRLLAGDGSVKKEYKFTDNYDFAYEELDGGICYNVENNRVVRSFVAGQHSYKTYEDSYYEYDSESDNWILAEINILINPMREDETREEHEIIKNQKIYLFDKEKGEFSGHYYPGE
jgi:hypothetical protein